MSPILLRLRLVQGRFSFSTEPVEFPPFCTWASVHDWTVGTSMATIQSQKSTQSRETLASWNPRTISPPFLLFLFTAAGGDKLE